MIEEKNTKVLDWMKLLTFGLDETERTVLNVLIHSDYKRVDCSDDFDMLLQKYKACIVVNPDEMDEEQLLRLNDRYKDDYSTIILFTQEPKMTLQIPWHLVDLESDYDRKRKKAIELLNKSRIPSIRTLDDDEPKDVGHRLSEGFVVVDVEISGLDPKIHEIIKISAVRVNDYRITDRFESLVKIDRPMNPYIEEITKITNEMIADAPTIVEAMAEFIKWYPQEPLVYYYKDYTLDFIAPAIIKSGNILDENRITIDLMNLAGKLYPGYFMNHSFQYKNIAKFVYGENSPSQYRDIDLEADLLIHLMNKMSEDYGSDSLADILTLYGKEII